MRYRAAVGVGEEAHSRQRHWCPWSKPVNVETWGHVPGPVVMAHAFAELRYGIVARQHENGFKCGYISAQTLESTGGLSIALYATANTYTPVYKLFILLYTLSSLKRNSN